jgi:hypothetical protein
VDPLLAARLRFEMWDRVGEEPVLRSIRARARPRSSSPPPDKVRPAVLVIARRLGAGKNGIAIQLRNPLDR